jgi:hypothetical protein
VSKDAKKARRVAETQSFRKGDFIVISFEVQLQDCDELIKKKEKIKTKQCCYACPNAGPLFCPPSRALRTNL